MLCGVDPWQRGACRACLLSTPFWTSSRVGVQPMGGRDTGPIRRPRCLMASICLRLRGYINADGFISCPSHHAWPRTVPRICPHLFNAPGGSRPLIFASSP